MSLPEIVRKNEDLKPYSWWQVGGTAEHFAAPSSLDELKAVLTWAKQNSHPVTIFSGGTNILFYGGVISGLVIGMSNLSGTDAEVADDHLYLTSWAGSQKAELLKFFLKYKLDPALFLTGLPGDVGGGITMNAGIGEKRVPREFCEITDWVEVLRWDESKQEYMLVKIPASEMSWSYRHSEGWQPGVIVRAGFKWPMQPNDNLMKDLREATRKRISSQPIDKPSCGSVFRNPEGGHSAKLIQECNLKGYKIGGASVSTKHANFIINEGDAKPQDIHQLICHVRDTVKKEKGIELQTEVKYLGWPEGSL